MGRALSALLAAILGLGACAAPGHPAATGVGHQGAQAPAGSEWGRRIIWSKSANRVWIVDDNSRVVRDYPVTDLDWKTPVGTYRVMKKSRRAYASDSQNGRQTLNYFVAFFRRCPSCSLIGFHAIPVTESGRQIQPDSSLGTGAYRSHGCIRQTRDDARFLYQFATKGTPVIVIQ